ncbi:MAG: SPOR domain-containing protein [Candidatus Neomarinimicrobiota bacterium]|nr:SPOR domain-containing protein [Candidatus Neomarinimicrobiota bacterium]MDD3966196.1 SPOR domain-containing protein [Candidatus Neomarinimicrobiota bacterium]
MKKISSLVVLLTLFVFIDAQNEADVVIYDNAFAGKETASGEIFSQDKLTAAHGNLPLGTRIEMYHVTSGKRVQVTVNDRIGNAPDLFWISRAAADSMGIHGLYPTRILYTEVIDGQSRETLKPLPSEIYLRIFDGLGPNQEVPESPENAMQIRGTRDENSLAAYAVQIYAAEKRADALELSRRIADYSGYISYIERAKAGNRILYRLIIGDFSSVDEARTVYEKLHRDFPEIIMLEIF